MSWKEYLNERGISDGIIESAEIDYKDPWIRIPYISEPSRPIKGRWFPSIPKETLCKYLWVDGSPAFPYLWETLSGNNIEHIYITEGEFDALILSNAFKSMGILESNKVISVPLGVNCWKPEWTRNLGSSLRAKVIAVFDNDEAGVTGASQLANRLGTAINKIVWPEDYNKGGDITDWWRSHKDNFLETFLQLPLKEVLVTEKKDDLVVRKNNPLTTCDLENIKNEVPIENEISKAGIKLTRTSVGYKAHCPWHEDRVPSFTIYKKTNSFYCYSCGKGGSVIDFLVYNNYSLGGAIRKLIFEYGPKDNTTTRRREDNKKEGTNSRKDGGITSPSGEGTHTV